MRIAISLFLIRLAQLAVKGTYGYQVTPPDQGNVYKVAIAKSLKKIKERPAIKVVDDDTFSPHIDVDKPAALPLSETIKTKLVPSRKAKRRVRWGIDKDPAEYWFNNKIHTFGNTGFFGGLHAAMAPVATKMIDVFAYDGENVRLQIAKELHKFVKSSNTRVLDLCCGVGLSTRALQHAFQDAEAVVGVDTSPEMIAMARAISRHDSMVGGLSKSIRDSTSGLFAKMKKKTFMMQNAYNKAAAKCTCAAQYARGNAERTLFPDESFDLVTIMYAFHEAPRLGRYRILREVRRLLEHGGTLALVDISPDYTPNPSMLAGEPYVLEYKENIQKQMRTIRGFDFVRYKEVVPGHVGVWLLTRNRTKLSKA